VYFFSGAGGRGGGRCESEPVIKEPPGYRGRMLLNAEVWYQQGLGQSANAEGQERLSASASASAGCEPPSMGQERLGK
jgi:hypothetical protein